jgi:hypothetical protein
MKFLAVLLMLSVEPPDCAQIKAMVTQHGKIAAYTWALGSWLFAQRDFPHS